MDIGLLSRTELSNDPAQDDVGRALQAAIALAGQGFAVFPCQASEAPACRHSHLDATSDADRVRDLWRRSPGGLIGTPTGLVNGFNVLGVDPRHGGAEWHGRNQHRLPLTRTHVTRAGGLHLSFRSQGGI